MRWLYLILSIGCATNVPNELEPDAGLTADASLYIDATNDYIDGDVYKNKPDAGEVILFPTPEPHAELTPLPELTDPGITFDVHPNDFVSWDAMRIAAQSANADTVRMFPGDYTSLGILTIGTLWQGTSQRRKVIRFVDANVPPWKRVTEARIAGFMFGDNAGTGTSYWIMHGLTIRGHTTENNIRMGSHHIVIDMMLIEDGTTYGVRGTLYAHDSVIQRSVIHADPTAIIGDMPGIQLRIPNDNQTPLNGSTKMHNWKLVNNQIFNYIDSIAVTHSVDNIPTPGGIGDGIINGTVIAGNDFYTTTNYHTVDGKGHTENALDLKGGSSDPLNPVRVIDNRIRGYRFSTIVGGSDGAGIVVHNWARNYYFARNFIYDCPVGIRVDIWPVGQPTNVDRNIVVEDSLFHGINIFAAGDTGKVFHARLPVTFRRNIFAHSTVLHNQTMVFGQHTFEDNIAINTPLGTETARWTAGPNNQVINPDRATTFRLVVNHITTPEEVLFAQTYPFRAFAGFGTNFSFHLKDRPIPFLADNVSYLYNK